MATVAEHHDGLGHAGKSMWATRVKRIKIGDWQQQFDDTHQTPYYVNIKTGVSQWERPACFPDLSRGPLESQPEVDVESVHKFIKTPMEVYQEQLLKRPARVQIDPSEMKKYHIEGTQEYNIWHDRYMGDHWKNSNNEGKSVFSVLISQQNI